MGEIGMKKAVVMCRKQYKALYRFRRTTPNSDVLFLHTFPNSPGLCIRRHRRFC